MKKDSKSKYTDTLTQYSEFDKCVTQTETKEIQQETEAKSL